MRKMDEFQMTVAAAELLEEAISFKEGRLCAFMLSRCESQVEEAQAKLSRVDPSDVKAIRDLQNQIWLAEHFEEWLDAAIDIGESAVEVWKQQQEAA